jgi:hypothetical protein
MVIEPSHDELFASLRALAASTFPKRCRNCGRVYASAEEFFAATQPVRADHTGLKQSLDDAGQPIVEIFRNCACGSTLLEGFHNRRDLSAAGIKRRARFEELLNKLKAAGVDGDTARTELLKMMRGQPNSLIELIHSVKVD